MRTVGHSPLVQIDGIFAKLECTNPCGSIKDRIALYILEESERRGLLQKGARVIEATSGNTGIAFAYFAKQKGYEITIVMPENMTEERKQILRNLGADLILCSKEGGFAEAVEIRDRLAREKNYFNPDQFSNPLNVECHYKSTGQEILNQIEAQGAGPIDAFVAGVGTGGTLIGVGRKLRMVYPEVCIAAVEPAESAVMSGKSPGIHGIAGIGDGFIPAIVSDGAGGIDPLIDEIICIGSEEAKEVALALARRHGYCIGISSGANYLAAKELSRRFRTVVTVFPDGYAKYQSQGLVHCETGQCPFEQDALV
ncbi:MAG: hypothetical protein A3G40_12355 [Deltaproteobacteria bacterium RIFCSPLOWO2_12_FULL_57_22]|nr:MAG: hypothetical protein A3G40_12355 [Deltaproteobacteria bacterium RIFCSPLOWO2_12_FULL_57_22]